eukprot:6430849-Prymnesium_polylepis.1
MCIRDSAVPTRRVLFSQRRIRVSGRGDEPADRRAAASALLPRAGVRCDRQLLNICLLVAAGDPDLLDARCHHRRRGRAHLLLFLPRPRAGLLRRQELF